MAWAAWKCKPIHQLCDRTSDEGRFIPVVADGGIVGPGAGPQVLSTHAPGFTPAPDPAFRAAPRESGPSPA
jgi:hypothetical protein